MFEPHDIGHLDTELFPFLNDEMERHRVRDWVVVISDTFQRCLEPGIEILNPRNYLYIDYMALMTSMRCNLPGQIINNAWNHSADKALLLTGKAHVLNRIGLIGRFYDLGMMDKLTWSLHLDSTVRDRCRPMFPHYTDDEYMVFIQACTRNPDRAAVEMRGDSSHYDGFPYDPALYSGTLFSIVSESFYSVPWFIISEKTYRAMMHPFVMAGPPGNLRFLESIGFETFSKHLPIPEYDSICDHRDRLDAVVENSIAFFDIVRDEKDAVSAGISHNRDVLMSRCRSGLDALRTRLGEDLNDDALLDLIRGF